MWIISKEYNELRKCAHDKNMLLERLERIESSILLKNDNFKIREIASLLNYIQDHYSSSCHNLSCLYLGECHIRRDLRNIVHDLLQGKKIIQDFLYTKDQITDLISSALKEAAIKESSDLTERILKALDGKLK